VNRWNQVHRAIRLVFFTELGLMVALIALAVVAPRWLPTLPAVARGAILVTLTVGLALLHAVDKQARRRMDPAPRGSVPAACGFCGRTQADLPVLMAGPEQYVCADCVNHACALPDSGDPPGPGPMLRCSFCGKERHVASVFLHGSATICSGCARIAQEGFVADAAGE